MMQCHAAKQCAHSIAQAAKSMPEARALRVALASGSKGAQEHKALPTTLQHGAMMQHTKAAHRNSYSLISRESKLREDLKWRIRSTENMQIHNQISKAARAATVNLPG